MKIKESSSFGPRPLVIDREAKVIRGVKVIGEVSKNGKVFPRETREKAHSLIEGLKVNVNHREKGKDALVTSRLGRLASPREEADGTYADLHYLESNAATPMLLEAAERMPDVMGFSILGSGKGNKKDASGRVIVESITGLESADLVADPANTVALNESVQLVESEEEAASCEELVGLLISRLMHEGRHDEADDHLRVVKKHTKKAQEGDEPEAEVEESTREQARANCIALCESSQVEPAPALLSVLMGAPRESRAKILQRWTAPVKKARSGSPSVPDHSELREAARVQQQDASSDLDRILAQIRG